MSPSAPFRLLLIFFALSAASMAQTAPSPCSGSKQGADKPCPAPSTPPPSAAQQFPFPGEANPPTAPTPNAPKPSADADHPFPTESPDMPGASSSSSSSSSSSGSGSDYTPDANRSTRRKLPKAEKLETPDQRVDEDLRVAKFYLDRENYLAAYMRSQDAVKTEPDYAPTHFSLAQAAQKMKKLDEAKAEYNAYLKLSPDGDDAKAARKALEELP